jgi:ABC-2 type transport system ATP-binding protein
VCFPSIEDSYTHFLGFVKSITQHNIKIEFMEKSLLKVSNLSHSYNGGKQWAIQDINFEYNQKGVLGLVGSNGAGKSTMMNIMCGVLNQTQGDIFINGINLRENPVEAKRYIGFLPQKPPLHFDLTIEEYLTHCAHLRLVAKKDVKPFVEAAMARCGITHFRKRVIRNLSGGFQQRVGIAQSILHNPMFVVMDEPTNGLDPNQILEIRALINEIAEERLVIFSTHILSEVENTCDHIKMIESGLLVFDGTMNDFNHHIEPDTVNVTLLAPPSVAKLKAIPGILSVEAVDKNQFKIKFNSSKDLSEKIVELSVSNGWRLKEINVDKISLEKIFAKLSRYVKNK